MERLMTRAIPDIAPKRLGVRWRNRLCSFIVAMIVSGGAAFAALNGPAANALPGPSSTASFSLTVTETSVLVAGATLGGDVVLFSYAKVARDGRIQGDARATVLHDEDGDGMIVLNVQVPLRSVWVGIDAASGAVASGAHPQFPLVVSEIAPSLLRKDAAGEIATLEDQIPRLVLLLVRPAKGAWMLRGRDGGDGDRDGTANGRLSLAFEDTRSILDLRTKGPQHLKTGDVLVAIDPGHLDVFIGQVAR
jgi:hypothetical protein